MRKYNGRRHSKSGGSLKPTQVESSPCGQRSSTSTDSTTTRWQVQLNERPPATPTCSWSPVADGRVIGTVMGGYDGHRGWVYSLAVDEAKRHTGIGSALMDKIEQALKSLGCLKVNLQVVGSNSGVVEFYEKLGFSVEDRISMGKRLY